MKLRERYRRLTPWSKVAFWASVFTIVGTPLGLLFQHTTSSGTSVVVGDSITNTGGGTTVVGNQNNVVVGPSHPAQPLDRLVVQMSFDLPMNDPRLASYKARLDRGIDEFLALPFEAQDARKTMAYSGWSIGLNKMQPRPGNGYVWLTSSDPLYPSQSEADVRGAFQASQVELAFFATPIDPATFRPTRAGVHSTGPLPQRPEPDLAIEGSFRDGSLWYLTKGYGSTRGYRLQSFDWTPPKTTWRENSSKIEFVDQLAGAQLFIDFGGYGPSPGHGQSSILRRSSSA